VIWHLPIIEVLAAFIGNIMCVDTATPQNECQQSVNRLSTEHQHSINRLSTECQQFWVLDQVKSKRSAMASVSNGSGLPGCGPGLEPDRTVHSGLLPGIQGYPPGSGTGSNRTAVPFYGSYNFGSN